MVVAFVSAENALIDADAHPAQVRMIIIFSYIAEIGLVVLARVPPESQDVGAVELTRVDLRRASEVLRHRLASRRISCLAITHCCEELCTRGVCSYRPCML